MFALWRASTESCRSVLPLFYFICGAGVLTLLYPVHLQRGFHVPPEPLQAYAGLRPSVEGYSGGFQ